MKQPEVSHVTKIAREGRALGVHLVMSTQNPSAKVIDGDIKANVTAVLALKAESPSKSQILIGKSGAQNLAGGGDAILKMAGQTKRMQVAIYREDDPQSQTSADG